jgi:hypothetical protein
MTAVRLHASAGKPTCRIRNAPTGIFATIVDMAFGSFGS